MNYKDTYPLLYPLTWDIQPDSHLYHDNFFGSANISYLSNVYLTLFPEEKEAVRKAATKPVNDEMKQHKNYLKDK